MGDGRPERGERPPREGPLQPGAVAAEAPERPAHVMAGSGRTVTYGELDERSRRLARALRDAGIRPGGHVALLMENHERFFEVCWAALRSGIYCSPVNPKLTPEEAAYVVRDCGAEALVVSANLGPRAAEVVGACPEVGLRLSVDGPLRGCDPYEAVLDASPPSLPADAEEGSTMIYSSGTTGRPKGVKRPLSGLPPGSSNVLEPFMGHVSLGPDTVYLSPAPLYHAAPLGWSLGVQRFGGTVVVMERFDAEWALELIERHRVTHAQLVPTMFSRMLELPEVRRVAHDLSSLEQVLHAGAPCPVEVKERVIEWLGPIVDEYYSGTEGSGITYVTAEEWLEHRGSVGRPILGEVHVLDDDGEELGPHEIGTIYFARGGTYEYHGDAEATAARRERRGWTTLDDVGYVDEDGYLYLTDRRDHMIVSGGVNVYPQEAEDVLAVHPDVHDVAVFGVPDADLGERVLALVEPAPGVEPGPALEARLTEHCRERLAHHKCPRSVDFTDHLGREETGKLKKQQLRERYWEGHTTRIV